MSYRIINYPNPVERSEYEAATEKMLQRLSEEKNILSVYSIGSVGNLGISDLDMVVVVEDQKVIQQNYLLDLSLRERYLFTHNLYAISTSDFEKAGRFTFFHNYILNSGPELRSQQTPSALDSELLKKQVALEFIVKMYINTTLQETYKVLRMRDVLLHVKALMYDFDFLSLDHHPFKERVNTVIKWRKEWFDHTPGHDEIVRWWNLFCKELFDFTAEVLRDYDFFLPDKPSFQISKNIVLVPRLTGPPSIKHKGILLPNFLSTGGKKFFRLQNRVNRFEFYLPAKQKDIAPLIQQKFEFESALSSYGKKYLPYFLPLTSSLHLH